MSGARLGHNWGFTGVVAMAVLTNVGDDEVQCSECDVVYAVIFQRNVVYDRVEYCPFCGDEIEDVEPE